MKVLDPQHSGKASGSIDGRTFYNYGNINCVRKLGIPSQPNTPRQLAVRGVLAVISETWSSVLTEGQREAWRNFAKDFVWLDLWGKEFILKGIALFTKINFQLLDFGKPLQITPPPAVEPSDIVLSAGAIEGGTIKFLISAPPIAEIAAQEIFIDFWLAGATTFKAIEQEEGETRIQFSSAGKPPAVVPVKSDFRHIHYLTETEWIGPPPTARTIEIEVFNELGAVFTESKKISLICRRYNKSGRYSLVNRIDGIVVPGV